MASTSPEGGDPTPSTLVVGVGNEALRDEGVGIHAVRALSREHLPPHVRLLDGGTGGLSLVARLEGVRRLVLVDAMDMGRRPGTIVTVRPEEIRRLHAADRLSLHGTGVLDVLELAGALGLLPPEVYVVGVQPAEVACGLELSPAVARVLPEVLGAALKIALPVNAAQAPRAGMAETDG